MVTETRGHPTEIDFELCLAMEEQGVNSNGIDLWTFDHHAYADLVLLNRWITMDTIVILKMIALICFAIYSCGFQASNMLILSSWQQTPINLGVIGFQIVFCSRLSDGCDLSPAPLHDVPQHEIGRHVEGSAAVQTGEQSIPTKDIRDLVVMLRWDTITIINDAENEIILSELSVELALIGVQTTLFSNTHNLSGVFTSREDSKHIIVICSKQLNDLHVGKPSTYYEEVSLLRHISEWLIIVETKSSVGSSLINTSDIKCLNTQETFFGYFDNVAILLRPRRESTEVAELGISSRLFTSMWGPDGRYFDELPLQFSDTAMPHSFVFPNTQHGLNGRHLIIGTLVWPPFVFKRNGTYYGFCVDILTILSERLNFSYSFIEPADSEYGTESGGTWSGLVGMLVKQEVDAVITDLIITYERKSVVDFSYPFLMDSATIVVQRSMDSSDHWWTFTSPLRLEVYLIALVSFTLVYGTVAVYTRCRCNTLPGKQTGLVDALWYLMGVPFRQGNSVVFEGLSGRPVVGSWWILTFLVTTVYTGNLIAFLTVTTDHPPFATAMQMTTDTDYKWGFVHGGSYLTLFQNSNLTVHKLLLDGIIKFNKSDPDILSSDQDVHFRKLTTEKYAYIGGRPVVTYWMRKNCQLRTLEDRFFPVQYSMAFPKGSAYKDTFSELVLHLVNTGYVDKLMHTWWPGNTCDDSERRKGRIVTITEALAAFGLAGAGILMAALVLIGEIVFELKHKKCN